MKKALAAVVFVALAAAGAYFSYQDREAQAARHEKLRSGKEPAGSAARPSGGGRG